MGTSPQEVREFCTWFDDEGGLASFIIARGTYDVPAELKEEANNLVTAWDELDRKFQALLEATDVTY